MLPAGAITEGMVNSVSGALAVGDIVTNGGNTFYKDDIRCANALQSKNISYVDVGTSGGVWRLERGYCMMIGGTKEAVDRLDPIPSPCAMASATSRTQSGRGAELWLYARWASGFRAFRQNDTQWYRIWLDAGLRRRV
jgi:6-phosphogluconate dehydrogenase